MAKCTGRRCPMQAGYQVDECDYKDCPWRTEPITNADFIRAMSDEELVVFLDGFSCRCIDCAEDAKNKSCPIYKEGRYCRPRDIMEWLKKIAEGE